MNEQLIHDLKGTRETLDRVGWCPTGAQNDDGALCVLAAAHRFISTGSSSARSQALFLRIRSRYMAVANQLMEHLPDGRSSVGYYNDDESTSREDIDALIDKALADLGGLG